MTQLATEEWTPRRSRWPLMVVLLLLAAGAAGAWWWFQGRVSTSLDRIAVLVHSQALSGQRGSWWSGNDRVSARVASALAKPLERYGLQVIASSSPELVRALDGVGDDAAALRRAAQSAGAGLVLMGTVRTVRGTPLTKSELSEYTVEVELEVSESADGAAAVRVVAPLVFNLPAASDDRAQLEVAEDLPDLVQPALAAALMQLPGVVRLKADAATLSKDDLAIASKVEPMFRASAHLQSERDRRQGEADLASKRDATDERGAERHLISDFLAEEYLVAVRPDGGLVLLTEPHHIDVRQAKGAYELRRGDERLVLADADGGGRALLAEVYNIFSFPSVSADGRWAAAVVDHRGWSKAVNLFEIPSGKRTELIAHEGDYYSAPQVSPDGSLVVFWHRSCRRCPSSLDVIRADGTDLRTLLEATEDESRSAIAWAPDGKRIYFSRRPSEELGSLWAVDPLTGDGTPLLGLAAPSMPPAPSGVDGDSALKDLDIDGVDVEDAEGDWGAVDERSFDGPVPSPDGTFLVAVERDGPDVHLGRLDLATGAWRRLADVRAQGPLVSPDGKWIAFETWRTEDLDSRSYNRDTEIALIPAQGGELRLLTINDEDDTLSGWSPDSSRIYFTQGSKDPSGTRYTNRVWWVAR